MKKVVLFSLMVLVSFPLLTVGCAALPYSFAQKTDEIERIEIVSIDNDDCSIMTSIPEVSKEAFLDDFMRIHFRRYLGDPSALYGYVIRFVYKDGSYEMVSWFTSEYISNGKKQYILIGCNEAEYNAILDKWMSLEA